jgi:hypothetical protein
LPEKILFEKKPFGIGLAVLHDDTPALLVDDNLRHQRRVQGQVLSCFELRLRHTFRLVAIHIVFTTAGFMPFERRTTGAQQQQGRAQEAGGSGGWHIGLD